MSGLAIAIHDPLLREGLGALIEREGPINIVASAADLEACLVAARQTGASTVLVDVDDLKPADATLLPGIRALGVKVIGIARKEDSDPKLVDIVIARSAGKDVLIRRIRESLVGGRSYGRGRTAYGGRLTPREHDVARLIAQGLPNREIASRLQLREQSIKNLASVVMRKLRCDNRVQVALQLSQGQVAEPESS
ncbi:MAG: response regulator transcription factor [Fimbriimonadaceae bacterium]